MPTKKQPRNRDENGKFVAKPQEPVVKPVVKEPVANVLIAISLCCTGGCIAPIIAIFSGVKAFKKDPSSQPVFVQQVYPNQVQQNEYQKEWRH